MRLKLDENLPIDAAETLRAAGHDARAIHDQQLVGKPDPHVALACRLEQRVLVTLDLDFADIRAYPPGEYPGIIVLRPRRQSKPDVLALIGRLLPLLDSEPVSGRLWIVQENGLRIRKG